MSFLLEFRGLLDQHDFEEALELVTETDASVLQSCDHQDTGALGFALAAMARRKQLHAELELEDGEAEQDDKQNTALVRALLGKGVDVDHGRCCADGKTPLCFAIRNGLLRVAELLVREGGADVELRSPASQFELSPLAEAIQHRVPEAVELLVAARADVNEECCVELPWEQWHQRDECMNFSPIGWCIWEGQKRQGEPDMHRWRCLELLVAARADVNQTCATKMSFCNEDQIEHQSCPLSFALWCNRGTEVVRLLLRAGATVDATLVRDGETVSMIDILEERGDQEKLQALCSAFAGRAALQLLMIRQLRVGHTLMALPLDVVKLIAQCVWMSRRDNSWLANEARSRHRKVSST